jgi:hypothetical protein
VTASRVCTVDGLAITGMAYDAPIFLSDTAGTLSTVGRDRQRHPRPRQGRHGRTRRHGTGQDRQFVMPLSNAQTLNVRGARLALEKPPGGGLPLYRKPPTPRHRRRG